MAMPSFEGGGARWPGPCPACRGSARPGPRAGPEPSTSPGRLLTAAGYHWYEVSNWARRPEDACRHNLAYWQGQDWWGVGCGAHSHVGGVRWWNLRHPRAYAQALGEGRSPAAGREVLSEADRRAERVLLGCAWPRGCP